MNLVDAIFAVILLLAMARGYTKGLLGTAAGYLAPVAGFMIATDFSDPVRDQLALYMTVPEIVLDMLAPVVLFLAVYLAVRITAALFGSLLGVGLSVPSRLLASVAGLMVSSLVLGAVVLVVRELRPTETPAVDSTGKALVGSVESKILEVDRRMNESLLAPPLAEFAEGILGEALLRQKNTPLMQPEEMDAATRAATEAAAAMVVESLSETPAKPASKPAK